MSDNTQLNPGANGDRIVTEEIGVGSGIKMQAMKVHTGAHGVDGDAVTTTNPLPVGPSLYNGTTTEQARSQAAANVGVSPLSGVALVAHPAGWKSTSAPAAATQATTTLAAGATGIRHVCTTITASLACGATAATPINVYLRDGATGAGPIIWAGVLAAPVDGSGVIAINGLAIAGSAATAMTLEFSAAGPTASLEAVTMTGYDVA